MFKSKLRFWSVSICALVIGFELTSALVNMNMTYAAPVYPVATATFRSISENSHLSGDRFPSCELISVGDPCTVIAPTATRDGYIFGGWNVISGLGSCSGNVCQIYGEEVFEPFWITSQGYITHSAKFSIQEGGAHSETLSCEIIDIGEPCTVVPKYVEREGYTQIGWGTNYATLSYCNGNICYLYDDSTFYAIWDAYRVTFNPNGGVLTEGEPVVRCEVRSDTYCHIKDYPHSVTRDGYRFIGWDHSGCSNPKIDLKWKFRFDNTFYACWEEDTETGGEPETGGGSGSGYYIVIDSDGEEEVIPAEEYNSDIAYYTVKYELDGGKFVTGETSRTVTGSNKVNLIAPATNPIKEGYKFIGWYNGNTKYTFGKLLSSDLTLTAKYEKISDSCTYTCNGEDIYDPSIQKCISISNDKLFTTDRIYEYNCNNNKYTVGSVKSCTGACEEIEIPTGYRKEYWVTKDTCFENASCTDNSTCETKWEAYHYKAYDATKECSEIDKTQEEIKNPEDIKTGDTMIYIVWALGILSLGYMVYHIYRLKNNEI